MTRSATWKRKFEDPEFAVKHAEQVGNNAFTHWSAEYLDARGWFWQFRSTWEREFAEALDRKGLTWFYEPARILLKDGRTYAPDFWVKEWNCFVEIKGWDGRPERLAKVEAARALGHKITLLLGKEQFTKALTALETAR